MKTKGRPQSVNIEKAKGYKPIRKKSAKKPWTSKVALAYINPKTKVTNHMKYFRSAR